MRILLIIATNRYGSAYPAFLSNSDFPTGFAYIAAALSKAGHEVFGVNPNNAPGFGSAYEMVQTKISRGIAEHQPDLIGIGGICTDFHFLVDAMKIIRETAPDIPVVCGGGIINNDAEFIFPLLHPDFCIIGDAEKSVVELAEEISSGNHDYERVANLGYWREGVPRFTERKFDQTPLDELPFPDYSPFGVREMLDNYSLAARYLYRYTRPHPRPMTLVAARSCPFNCSFCVHDHGAKYQARSIENIIEEIAFLYEKYQFNILIILDELFAVNKQRLGQFCEALIENRRRHGWDFDWLFQTHARANLDLEALRMAKEAGCFYFSYGIESASPAVLASMNKKIKPEMISQAIDLAAQAEIGFGGNFILGDLAETEATVAESLDFAARHCLDTHVFFADIRPYPGSAIFNACVERGIISNRLEFYRKIDAVGFNMTRMTNAVWARHLQKIYELGTFPFVKPTPATEIQLDPDPTDARGMDMGGARNVWYFRADCPHCSREFSYRDLVDIARAKAGDTAIITGCPHCGKRVKIIVTSEQIRQSIPELAQKEVAPEQVQ